MVQDILEKIGVGPATAFKLIVQNKKIETVLKEIEKENEKKQKYVIPKPFNYEDARELFIKPIVDDPSKIDVENSFFW